MREILFRGKRVDNGEWVHGYYVNCHGPNCEPNNTRHYILEYPDKWHEIYTSTIGQYTGLKDRNGKMIWEGDILKISRKMDGMGNYYVPPLEYPVKVVVKWDMCAWMWETIEQDKYYISFPEAWCHFDCDVIGNVHDNAELLKGE